MSSEKTFISYSWSTPEHEQWVLTLAEELVSSGVDVILDKWALKEGHDLVGFMERMVTDPEIKKVIMICDKGYVEKADGRAGGVGTETQIISKEVYDHLEQEKFVAILAERDGNGKAFLPAYYASRKYIDMSNDVEYVKNIETLLRWIYNKPMYVRPKLGQKPAFLDNSFENKISSQIPYKRAIQAISENKGNKKAELRSYYSLILNGLENYRMEPRKADDEILRNIDELVPVRNELSSLFEIIAIQSDKECIAETLWFFEELIKFQYPSENTSSYSESDFDNYKFFNHECFLLLISTLLKNHKLDICKQILEKKFFINNPFERGAQLRSYDVFYNHLRSLERINEGRSEKYISFHGTLLKERADKYSPKFNYIMQADFICYLYYAMSHYLLKQVIEHWYPVTLVYSRHNFYGMEIFVRAADKHYFRELLDLLPVSLDELELFANAVKDGRVPPLRFDYSQFNILGAMAYDKLNSI